MEKLDGANVKILTGRGRLLAMFDWYYSPLVEIYDYDRKGRDEIEDQEKFD